MPKTDPAPPDDNASASCSPSQYRKRLRSMDRQSLLSKLGPGLVTGAADDDPSGIATYSQSGAQYGNHVLWIMLFSYPLMSAVQEICGRIGRVSGHGLAANIRKHYPKWLLYAIAGLTVLANTLNLGADLAAMGEAVRLLIGGPPLLYATILAALSLLLPMFCSYSSYARFLKWLTWVLFSYVIAVFTVHIDWKDVLESTFLPWRNFSSDQMQILVAILGTTISPYLFFWQSSQEVEEVRSEPCDSPLKKAPRQAVEHLRRIRVDTYLGMAVSNLIAYFIILTTAAALHHSGRTDIQSAAQAAEALRPLAGNFSFILFAAGIVGTGLLSAPVLAGSAAYVTSETLKWKQGLSDAPQRAKRFYGAMAAYIIAGLALNLLHINPIKALVWAAVVNGVVAGPVLVVMMLIAINPKVMGEFPIRGWLKWLGWAAAAVMILSAVGMFLL